MHRALGQLLLSGRAQTSRHVHSGSTRSPIGTLRSSHPAAAFSTESKSLNISRNTLCHCTVFSFRLPLPSPPTFRAGWSRLPAVVRNRVHERFWPRRPKTAQTALRFICAICKNQSSPLTLPAYLLMENSPHAVCGLMMIYDKMSLYFGFE
jgi:hypothetical protein